MNDLKFGQDVHVRESACPECGHKMDGAAGLDVDATPKAGDFTVCIRCATLLIYKPDFSLRRATAVEMLDELTPEQRSNIIEVQRRVAAINAR